MDHIARSSEQFALPQSFDLSYGSLVMRSRWPVVDNQGLLPRASTSMSCCKPSQPEHTPSKLADDRGGSIT